MIPVALIIGVVAFLGVYVGTDVPAPGDIKQAQVSTIVNSKGRTIARIVPEEGNRTDVKISDVPVWVQDAVIAAEDREFRTNSGFSIRGLTRAVRGKLTNNDSAGGGSTITQQYVKNALVGDEVSYKRKFKEIAIATKMSNEWSKDDILAAYLNTIYFGRGAYGISAASQAYFRKPVQKLTPSEGALIAGIIRSPSLLDPAVNEESAKIRWNYVLDGMVSNGAMSPSDRAAQKFPKTKTQPKNNGDTTSGPSGLVKRQVMDELTRLGVVTEDDLRTEGLKITTTIDPQVQTALVKAANGKLEGEPKNLRDAAVSIDPKTGAVRGYFGGNDGQGWDYSQAGLQTGSSFKVFALVAALEQGIPLSQTYDSSPYNAPGGLTVNNSDGESCGTCNLATAMKMSLNTVYYRLMMDLKNGAEDVADAAHKAGVVESFGTIEHTLQEKNGKPEGGVVLGQYPSRVIDMASAYATLAASGVYHEPYFVQKVETSDGVVLYEHKQDKGKRVFPAKVADNVTAALEPIAGYSNGNSLYDPNLGARKSAAKTGTAQLGDTGNNKDAWMVGYTPQLSTAVWVGTDKGTALLNYGGANVYGSGLPAQIWKAAMDAALDGEPLEDFPEPDAVGGQAGVPYEPPPTTYTPPADTGNDNSPRTTSPRGPTRNRPQIPTIDEDGGITLAPGVTLTVPGAGDSGNGGGAGGDDSGTGADNNTGNTGGDDSGTGGNNTGGDDGGEANNPPFG
ncbi:putative penicillin-binding protein [Gordonia amarae NBRC 15530]|nr:putative penicillin-binding protein [Gordonia amarae NBRC 15530]